ncbi:hypothetical protein [Gracilibacillus lacisalsi]|uniref:hypothetical protein n=1 Tax=Gracilibacillus lacisalsi TaxID=393087 RepID=UPI00035CC0C5|nr:hypothetical protein [Gracilibacillus lacisalsi]
MGKISLFVLSTILLFGLFACSNSQYANDYANQHMGKHNKQSSKTNIVEVKKTVWSQLSAEQKEWVNGTWEDGNVSKITLNQNMIIHLDDQSYQGEEVYLIDYPTKNTGMPNNMIVYADLETLDYIGNGLVD